MIGDSDIGVFLDDGPGGFATEAIFHLGTEQAPRDRRVTGIFDNAFFDASVGEAEMDTTAPRFLARHAEVRDIPRETLVRIGGVLYSVLQVQPDGTGMATVTLAHEP